MLFFKHSWPELSWEEIKRRARLLVIDDTEFSYTELFRRDGYTIEQWRDVEDLSELEGGNYDIIMLDIRGVGETISKEEGLGVLKYIRQVCPAQFVIAYSASDYDLSQHEFFRLADAVMPKSADYVDFKKEVDKLLHKRFSVDYYVKRILTEVGNRNYEKIIRRAIKRQNADLFIRKIERKIDDQQIIELVIKLLNMAISIYAVVHNFG